MRYLILSDIHANWEALEAVMAAAEADGYDRILCLGDLVGYGADPNACIGWIREHTGPIVRGNHDKACAGLVDLEWFNAAARASVHWTRATLTPENHGYLLNLPAGPAGVDDFQIIHGAPQDEDEYLLQAAEVEAAAPYLQSRVTLFGHTHMQGGFRLMKNSIRRIAPVREDEVREEYEIDPESCYMINPGSVGQPRDHDPRAAWALYMPHDRVVIYRRVAYNVGRAQRKITEAGLPAVLAQRLGLGR